MDVWPVQLGGAEVDETNPSLDIILTSEKAPGLLGIVHLGTMDIKPVAQKVHIAVKLAFSSYEKAVLWHEYTMCRHYIQIVLKKSDQKYCLWPDRRE